MTNEVVKKALRKSGDTTDVASAELFEEYHLVNLEIDNRGLRKDERSEEGPSLPEPKHFEQ